MGHVISSEGVAADNGKVQAMTDWPTPRNNKELRGFLGLTGYYIKFTRGYGAIARPLTALLKKDQFKWGEEASTAFQQLKHVMPIVLVFALPDFSAQFVVELELLGLGVLMQGHLPIAYFRQALT